MHALFYSEILSFLKKNYNFLKCILIKFDYRYSSKVVRESCVKTKIVIFLISQLNNKKYK